MATGQVLVDGSTGERSMVSSDTAGIGENVINLQKVTLDPLRAVVYGWSVNFEALFQFNLLTGDRVVVSK